MCGIFGAVGDPAWVEGLRLERAVDAMRHRGPDGSGTYRSRPALRPTGRPLDCVLAHTRLAIVDLTDAAAQPMTTSDGRYTLVYNGEVFNFPDLRRELEEAGEKVVSTGDTEVLLKTFARLGPSAAERFRGMFAFAVWDEVERTILLCRDRFGIKPLYYTQGPEGIAFASEVRTLLASGAARRVLSPRGLIGYLRVGSVPEPDTLVDGVRALWPGHILRFGTDGSWARRFWTYPSGPSLPMSRAEAVEVVRPILHESVRMRLVSDVPFGIFLSGGVDSSALTAIASAESARPVHTFTVTFDERRFSEESWAKAVAERYGCVHHSVRVTGEDAARMLADAFRAQDQPSGDGFNTYLVSRAARGEGLTMALTGLGGDEVFAGYRNFHHFAGYLRLSRLGGALPAGLVSLLNHVLARPGAWNRTRKLAALATTAGDPWSVYAVLRGFFTEAQIESLLTGPAHRRVKASELESGPVAREDRSLDANDPVNLFTRLELTGYLRNTLLKDTDAMSMANALEVRPPFVDQRLLEAVATIPGPLKVDSRVNKPLLVSAVSSLPKDTGQRPKMGFVLPFADWFRGPLRPGMEAALLDLRGPSAGVLRREPLNALWKTFAKGESSVTSSRLWALASLATWIADLDLILPW